MAIFVERGRYGKIGFFTILKHCEERPMPIEPTVFSQVMRFLPLHSFRRCVARYGGNYKVKSFTCMDQFLCMAFAQLTYWESLRDIEACLRVMQSKLYHMGFRGQIARSTLADANEVRDWHIYADFAQVLIAEARPFTKMKASELNSKIRHMR
jgi:hypothetical protein